MSFFGYLKAIKVNLSIATDKYYDTFCAYYCRECHL